jgi:hypothetical protein
MTYVTRNENAKETINYLIAKGEGFIKPVRIESEGRFLFYDSTSLWNRGRPTKVIVL